MLLLPPLIGYISDFTRSDAIADADADPDVSGGDTTKLRVLVSAKTTTGPDRNNNILQILLMSLLVVDGRRGGIFITHFFFSLYDSF